MVKHNSFYVRHVECSLVEGIATTCLCNSINGSYHATTVIVSWII